MSLRQGKHIVAVQTSTVEFVKGIRKDVLSEPETFHVNVHPVSITEREALGLTVEAVYRMIYFPQAHGGKPWPGGPYSRITWNGREFDQQGDAMISSMSPRTGHVKIIMAARSTKAN